MKLGDMTDGIFLMHIVDALKETIEFTDGVGMSEFLDSRLLVRAVTSSFEIAGEATPTVVKRPPLTLRLVLRASQPISM